MIEKVKRGLDKWPGVFKGVGIVLAVSGGLDSMCLWYIFRKLKIKYIVAHCNFGLRGEESDADESFVRSFAESGEKVFTSVLDTHTYASEKRISIQMAARELRYNWFRELKIRNSFKYIATAHHLDDQVETFFIQVQRKSDPWDLTGIPQTSGDVIRPFHRISRAEIEDFAEENKIAFREDSSNLSDKYLRNKIRHHLIPAMERVHPEMKIYVDNLCERNKEFSSELVHWFEKKNREIREVSDNQLIYPVAKINELELRTIFLRKLLRKYGFSRDLDSDLLRMFSSQTGKQLFSKDFRILIDRSRMIISPLKLNEDDKIQTTIRDLKSGNTPLVSGFTMSKSVDFIPVEDENIAELDLDLLEDPVVFRKWRVGDKFVPLGMKQNKKLSDFFIDEKMSVLEKEKQWIMTSGDKICWIPGRRIDERFKISDKTKRILSLEFISSRNE